MGHFTEKAISAIGSNIIESFVVEKTSVAKPDKAVKHGKSSDQYNGTKLDE